NLETGRLCTLGRRFIAHAQLHPHDFDLLFLPQGNGLLHDFPRGLRCPEDVDHLKGLGDIRKGGIDLLPQDLPSGLAGVHRNDAIALFLKILHCEVARPVPLGARTDHRDRAYRPEDAEDVGVGIAVVLHALHITAAMSGVTEGLGQIRAGSLTRSALASLRSPGVEQPPQTQAGRTGKTKGDRLAAGRSHPLPRRRAEHFRTPSVSDHKPALARQDLPGKVRWNCEIKPFAPLEVFVPLPVRSEVCQAGLDLDRQEFAIAAQRHHVETASAGEGEFRQARIAEILEEPADTTGEETSRLAAPFQPPERIAQRFHHAVSDFPSESGRSSSSNCSAACCSATSGAVVSLRGSSSKTTAEVRGSMSTKCSRSSAGTAALRLMR